VLTVLAVDFADESAAKLAQSRSTLRWSAQRCAGRKMHANSVSRIRPHALSSAASVAPTRCKAGSQRHNKHEISSFGDIRGATARSLTVSRVLSAA
jgi:hypothetical protein